MAAPLEKRKSFRILGLITDSTNNKTDPSPNFAHRNSVYKKPPDNSDGGILHMIPDIEISQMEFNDEYDIEKTIAEGFFAKILLASHRPTQTTVVLKAVHVELTNLKDFIKEFHYSYQLSHHPNILSAYNVAFQTKAYYVFAQEHAPYGDLAANVGQNGLQESACKLIAEQLSSALGFMHSKNLVHRDLKLENVLIFTKDFSRVKLCDFGATTKKGSLVNKINHTWVSFLPPEVLEIVKNERFICKTSSDSWQFGILLYTILTGNPPWECADWVKDTSYAAFLKYQKKETTKIPENFQKFSTRLFRCFRRYFDHDEENRAKVTEITKYMKDKWTGSKLVSSKSAIVLGQSMQEVNDQDSVCVYLNEKETRASVDEGKARLKKLMSSYGLETNIDQTVIKKQILEWLSTCENNNAEDIETF